MASHSLYSSAVLASGAACSAPRPPCAKHGARLDGQGIGAHVDGKGCGTGDVVVPILDVGTP